NSEMNSFVFMSSSFSLVSFDQFGSKLFCAGGVRHSSRRLSPSIGATLRGRAARVDRRAATSGNASTCRCGAHPPGALALVELDVVTPSAERHGVCRLIHRRRSLRRQGDSVSATVS